MPKVCPFFSNFLVGYFMQENEVVNCAVRCGGYLDTLSKEKANEEKLPATINFGSDRKMDD